MVSLEYSKFIINFAFVNNIVTTNINYLVYEKKRKDAYYS